MRVLVVGPAAWNTILHVPSVPPSGTVFASRAYDTVGGTSAGKALNLVRLGHEVHVQTVLGADDAGARVAAALREAGVQLHVTPGVSEQHVNLMGADGGRLSVFRTLGCPASPLEVEPVVELAANCDAIVVDLTDWARALIPALVRAGLPFWTDLHDWDGDDDFHRDFLAASTITLSADRLGDRVDEVCSGLAGDRDLVVCTNGAAGATAWSGGQRLDVPIHPVADVVDTNGAGDAFFAGLLHATHLGWPLERTLEAAAIAGATAVQSPHLASDQLTAEFLDVSASREIQTRSTPPGS